MAVSRSSDRFSGASGTKKRPSGNASRLREATSIASRVLPMPPGPTSVNKRQDGLSSSAPSSSISRDRPRKRVVVCAKSCILALLDLLYIAFLYYTIGCYRNLNRTSGLDILTTYPEEGTVISKFPLRRCRIPLADFSWRWRRTPRSYGKKQEGGHFAARPSVQEEGGSLNAPPDHRWPWRPSPAGGCSCRVDCRTRRHARGQQSGHEPRF